MSLGGAEDFFNFAGELERRQVEHDADTDAGADIGRAGGQVAEARVEAVVELGLEGVVDLVDLLPGLFQLQAGAETWMRQVVLLVIMIGDWFVLADRRRRARPRRPRGAC
jgi:hypothetical protein